ncbi:unnamed protein product [Ceratitis capitata]|uniref:(Mediterranean fruit fly) hypothetical protein n=1 Tax=Ceratitis capitata TaxID=7213 RepID=A0A811UYH7_CERCA|nr:unnamed protein product [Ceratitis capitata]
MSTLHKSTCIHMHEFIRGRRVCLTCVYALLTFGQGDIYCCCLLSLVNTQQCNVQTATFVAKRPLLPHSLQSARSTRSLLFATCHLLLAACSLFFFHRCFVVIAAVAVSIELHSSA